MNQAQVCPRAAEDGATLSQLKPPFNGEMVWREDRTCSYCGSLDPDVFMARLEAGDVELGPTDKSYKVYIRDLEGKPVGGPAGKFYFQHLNAEQQGRFIELYNARKIKMGFPGHFYNLPFFCRPAPIQVPDDGA